MVPAIQTLVQATQDALPADGDYEVAEVRDLAGLHGALATSAAPSPSIPFPVQSQISFDEFRQLPRHSVMLLGNLGRDIEVRTTSTGKDVASVGLAVTVGVSPRDEQGGGSNVPYTQWYNLTFWQDAAHAAATNVRKGSQVLVIGNLSKGTAPNSTKERLEVGVESRESRGS